MFCLRKDCEFCLLGTQAIIMWHFNSAVRSSGSRGVLSTTYRITSLEAAAIGRLLGQAAVWHMGSLKRQGLVFAGNWVCLWHSLSCCRRDSLHYAGNVIKNWKSQSQRILRGTIMWCIGQSNKHKTLVSDSVGPAQGQSSGCNSEEWNSDHLRLV